MTGISAIFRRAVLGIETGFNKVWNCTRNIWAAMVNPGAMTPEQRHLDEFKLLAGGSIAGAGVLEINPLVLAGGAIPAWESIHDMEHAGHLWRDHKKKTPYLVSLKH